MRNIKRATIALFLILLTSCAVSNATIKAYSDPSLTKGSISKLAVFPVRNARLAPSEANQINRKISSSIKNQSPNIKIMSSTEAIRKINDKNLADDWAKFLDDYTSSGIPNVKVLQRIGKQIGVDSIMQGELVNVVQQDGQYTRNVGMTRVTVRFSILDTKTGKLLWEASSDGVRQTASTVEPAPPLVEAINLAIDKILQNLPAI